MSFITKTSYTGNGTLKEYNVPFPYLRKADVLVYLGDTLNTAYSWLTDETIQFVTAPANAVVIRVERNTLIDDPTVDYADASTLTERDLDASARQEIFKLQEQQTQIDYLTSLIASLTIAAGNLPAVNSSNNGQILMVVAGVWTLYAPEQITVVSDEQIDATNFLFQKKTRTAKVISPSAESGWTTTHAGQACA